MAVGDVREEDWVGRARARRFHVGGGGRARARVCGVSYWASEPPGSFSWRETRSETGCPVSCKHAANQADNQTAHQAAAPHIE